MKKLILAAALVVIATPALAGSLNFSNGKGMWQSTLCSRPVPPAFVGLGSDSSAATLNSATASYNAFVQQSQDYQKCLSAEAKSDGESANGLITQMVDRQMQDAQLEVERAKGQLFGRNVPQQAMQTASSRLVQQPVIIEQPAVGQPTQLQPVSQPMMQQPMAQPALQIPQPAAPQQLQPPQYQSQSGFQPQPLQAPQPTLQPLDQD